jgi:AraC-like DNA-binding protein
MARSDIHNLGRWRRLARKSGYRVAVLAANMHISLRQLRRYAHEIFGRELRSWLKEQRLSPAKRELKRLHRVKDAAYALGFEQASHFSREFKKLYGVPPAGFLAGLDRQRAVSR